MRRKRLRRSGYYRDIGLAEHDFNEEPGQEYEVPVGQCVRALREECGLSMRALANKSGLAVNTLSLIENGKSSPSVTTLQKISGALKVPLVAFFLLNQDEQKVIYTRNEHRKQAVFEHGLLEDLGVGLSDGALEPFIITLEPHSNSGPDAIIHTGYEFVFCLAGQIAYIIENQRYILNPGDSLFFESHLPHCWQNLSAEPSKKILILCAADENDHPIGRHFKPDQGMLI
jgi:transcriptional regulator with XRE-family HTH domain